jgi:outer membrane protein TolC
MVMVMFKAVFLSLVVTVLLFRVGPLAAAPQQPAGPAALTLSDVLRLAAGRRDEIEAARARSRAGEERPTIVSALDDPMVSPALDHLPFMMGGADVSVTIEQQLPLSGVRRHRREATLADLDRLRAEVSRTRLDVQLEAALAFVMLQERQRTEALLATQVALARDVVTAAGARYSSGTGPQADVLRAEVELARLDGARRAIAADRRAAEIMLNASLARETDDPIPALPAITFRPTMPVRSAITSAVDARPELAAGRADIARANADVQVMRDMFRPMATIRTGPAYTMAEGRGWMAMVGLSLPIWRGKLRAGVAEAEQMRNMATADLRAMRRMFEGDAIAATHRVDAARERQRAVTTEVLPRARMTIEPTVAAYAAGLLPLSSVIESVQTLWVIEAEVIVADMELAIAWLRLGRALGNYEVLLP